MPTNNIPIPYLPPNLSTPTSTPAINAAGSDLFTGSASTASQFQPAADAVVAGWFAQPSGEEESWIDKVWDWAKSDTGVSVLKGGLSGLASMYSAELDRDRLENQIANSEAVLKDKRIAQHNKSINAPVSLRLRK